MKLVLGKLMQAGREVKGAVVESLPLELAISELGINNKEPAKTSAPGAAGRWISASDGKMAGDFNGFAAQP